ncbi:MAG TPA: 50S ribosomal protein L6 [Bacilli bacterium]|nr:50S ribosomal protein L6 [Bacilli bacterium]
MSRIGYKVIKVPAGVEIALKDNVVTVKGEKGVNEVRIPEFISLDMSTENEIHVKRANELKATKQLHGTTRSLLYNAIVGVSEGYTIKLELIGIGYRAAMDGERVILEVGYSHETSVSPVPGAVITVEKPTLISVTGHNKQAVGQTAAEIRRIRPPEPYKGKGIKYVDEVIRRKEGKRAGA